MATRSSKTSTTAKARKSATSSSRTRKTTAATRTSATKAPAKSATPAPAKPAVVEAPKPVVAGPVMRKPELIQAVMAQSGMKKKDVKPVVEAMLAVLGSALQDGRELNLQPMGKVKVNREKKLTEGKMLIVKIRQPRDLPSLPAADEQDASAISVDTPAAAE